MAQAPRSLQSKTSDIEAEVIYKELLMEKVLVVFASKMGSTGEIAGAIGEQLRLRGLQVDVRPAVEAPDARNYDAVIIGSGVYIRRWHRDALRFLQAQAPDLAERPTWLFQSGPCGPATETPHNSTPHAVVKWCRRIGLNPPVVFGGSLDPEKANSMLARMVAKGDLAGDFRDWAQIRTWADSVADQLEAAGDLATV